MVWVSIFPCCQVEALLASHHLTNPAISEDHKEALSALEGKLNEAICKFGEDGVFLKLNTQGVKDVVLDQSDPDHVTSVQVSSQVTLLTVMLILLYSLMLLFVC